MKTALNISDSVESTVFDFKRCTATIKDYGLDPLAVVPRIVREDGSFEEFDVSEMLDYAFGECEFAAMGIGFLTNPGVILYIADMLEKGKTAPVICCPSLISDEGEILVDSEVYEALCDRLLHFTDFLIVNTIEAEAFCGFECPSKDDFLRAAKKIYNIYGCRVMIKGGERTGGQNVLYEGEKPVWIDERTFEPGYEDKYSLLAALTCEFALGKPEFLAATLALSFVHGTAQAEQNRRDEEKRKAQEMSAAENEASGTSDAGKTGEPEPRTEPDHRLPENYVLPKVLTKVPTLSKPAGSMTSSLVTPGMHLRELAREITPAPQSDDVKPAVTSTIEKKETARGEVTDIADTRYKFDTEVRNSITELQSLKDRLNNLNRLADAGK